LLIARRFLLKKLDWRRGESGWKTETQTGSGSDGAPRTPAFSLQSLKRNLKQKNHFPDQKTN